jgi:YbbR domain-containing protein
MKQFLLRNLGWKLLSFAIAFAMWVVVAREPELATVILAPVQFKNIPDDVDFGTGVPDRVNLEVRGPADRLTRAQMADMAVVFDLADARPGERTYTVRESNLNLPYGISFYRAIPSQVTMRFQQLVSRDLKVVPVPVNATAGYRVSAITVTPATIRVRGPEDRLKNASEVQTDPIDLAGVIGTKLYRVDVNAGDPRIRLETPGPVTVDVTLAKISGKGMK